MKIILLKDIAGIGRHHDVKDVSDGFARNQLIPRGDAEMATPKALAEVAKRKERIADTKRLERSLLDKNIALLKEKTVTISRKANEKGHLFAKIKPQDIAEAIREQFRIEIPVSVIALSEHIEMAGEHRILLASEGARSEILLVVKK
ncbi:MAG: 50S ribosomal protein L9 [Patescibacteria group bacterium]